MAMMRFNSKMVYWKVVIHGRDMTTILQPFISGIRITNKLYPNEKNAPIRPNENPATSRKHRTNAKERIRYPNRGAFQKKAEHSPTEAEITVTSKSYVEDLFIEGTTIQIFIGYDPITMPLVFDGICIGPPEGSAREMMNYRVKAFSMEMTAAYEQKNRTFYNLTKASIVAMLAAENGLIPIIDMEYGWAQLLSSNGYSDRVPMQRGESDLEFLIDCAEDWNCDMWIEKTSAYSNTRFLHFVDHAKAHGQGNLTHQLNAGDFLPEYSLGYRTDKVSCNVEQVAWRFVPPRAGSASNPGSFGTRETGKTHNPHEHPIMWKGQVYILKKEYIEDAKTRPSMFLTYAMDAAKAGYGAAVTYTLRKYFTPLNYTEGTHMDAIPTNTGGWSLSIDLNEGDPYLKPPRTALLYCGSLNPKADSADLPSFLLRNGPGGKSPARLRMNEVILNFNHGALKTTMECTMDAPTGPAIVPTMGLTGPLGLLGAY